MEALDKAIKSFEEDKKLNVKTMNKLFISLGGKPIAKREQGSDTKCMLYLQMLTAKAVLEEK